MLSKVFRALSSSTSTTNQPSPDIETQKRLQQIQEYFSQYIEEYYEEEESPETTEKPVKVDDRILLSTLDDVLKLLEQEKAQNIKVIDLTQVASSPYSYMVICSPFNPRHGKALSEQIRRCIKISVNEDSINRHQMDFSNSSGWYCVQVNEIQIHVMNPTIRERFDLDSLWEESKETDEAKEKSWTDEENVVPPPVK